MTEKPNVIVCICDQLRAFEVGSYGNSVIQTPNLDRIASEGIRFEHAVSNNPVCMPARSCLLSGEFSRTCMGFLGNYAARNQDGKPLMPEYPVEERVHLPDTTLAEAFRSMGYDTALFGKWHVHPSPGTLGFDYSMYPRVHHRHTGQTFVENSGTGEVVDGFSIDFEADRVSEYLASRGEDPFFMYYSISPPHMPLLDAPEKYLDMYCSEDIPLRPNVFRDGQLPYDARWFKIYLWDFLFYDQHLPYTSELPRDFDLRKLIALYYGMTTWVDDTVGRLLENVSQNGLSEDTIIVFLSDHGDNLGSHHQFNKGELIEESIRIPMIFHAPPRWGPQVVDQQVAQIIDVMPTLISACGGTVPGTVQGRDLSPILSGTTPCLPDTDAFIETSNGQIGLRTPRHLAGLRLNTDRKGISDVGGCFFDLDEDPYEMHNLADSSSEAVLPSLRIRLIDWNRDTPWLETAD